jgi:hypothetical protein
MVTLTIWEVLTLLSAGAFLGVAGLIWLMCALVARHNNDAAGCFERTVALAAAAAGIGLLPLVIG